MNENSLRASFEERGYLAPVPLFSRRECQAILARLLDGQERPPLDWGKGWAFASADYHALATDDRILELVTLLLGEDVLLWGALLLARKPGQVHGWHTDIESSSPTGETVSAWIGLAETNPLSSLKAVPYSHRFGMTLQQVRQEHGKGGGAITDADVAGWAKERDGRSEVVSLDTFDGEALLFDGRLWHGSHNLNRHATRYALLLQYATPATPIRLPDFHRPAWPFEFHRAPRPPCIVVGGHDVHGVNRVLPGPAPKSRLPALSSRIHSLQLPLERDPAVGWKPHPLFRGTTPAVASIGCHVSVLEPGCQPHPPHRHEDEELLMLLDGEADLVVADPADPEQTVRRRAQRGSFAYYPAGFAHTVHNAYATPVTYVMFKWTTDRGGRDDLLEHQLVSVPQVLAEMAREAPSGRSGRGVFNGETRHLWRLGSHVTTLQPGAGYEPHVDSYDVAIVVLQGTVETLGERVGPDSVIFYAAGEPHGMRNVGDGVAAYVVFEFRGRPSKRDLLEDRRPSRRLWRLLRDPRRLKNALAQAARAVVARARRRLPIG